MRVVIQRTKDSTVMVNGRSEGKSNFGMTILVCMEKNDSIHTIEKAAKKILAIRIFEDEQKRIFEPFFTTKAQGTGLGLAICKQELSLFGADLNLNMQTQTTFELRLPDLK